MESDSNAKMVLPSNGRGPSVCIDIDRPVGIPMLPKALRMVRMLGHADVEEEPPASARPSSTVHHGIPVEQFFPAVVTPDIAGDAVRHQTLFSAAHLFAALAWILARMSLPMPTMHSWGINAPGLSSGGCFAQCWA